MNKKQITIKDMRRAISYVGMSGTHNDIVAEFNDKQLLAKDFTKDLNMGNIRVANVLIELERIHNMDIPMEVFKMMPDNTVGSFLNSVNGYLNGTYH